jgi:hypothetical protein
MLTYLLALVHEAYHILETIIFRENWNDLIVLFLRRNLKMVYFT